jgi:hypothetical protein
VSSSTLRLVPEIGLVDVADPRLSERLAGKVSDQLEAFAERMREGLLAASVAIGLDVMGELVEAEVAEVAEVAELSDEVMPAEIYGGSALPSAPGP